MTLKYKTHSKKQIILKSKNNLIVGEVKIIKGIQYVVVSKSIKQLYKI